MDMPKITGYAGYDETGHNGNHQGISSTMQRSRIIRGADQQRAERKSN